jgi:hypothetical protein
VSGKAAVPTDERSSPPVSVTQPTDAMDAAETHTMATTDKNAFFFMDDLLQRARMEARTREAVSSPPVSVTQPTDAMDNGRIRLRESAFDRTLDVPSRRRAGQEWNGASTATA